MTQLDERIKLALGNGHPFNNKGIIYMPLKTMDDALTDALELIPIKYKENFRQFYDGDRNQNPQQEFIDYLYSIGDEDIKKALCILHEAQHSLVDAHIEIKLNVEKMKEPFRKN